MTDQLFNVLILSVVGVTGYIIREIWTKIKNTESEVCEMKAEIVKRDEVTYLVEKEISRLRTEIKKDHQHLKDLLAKTDEKLDLIYDILKDKE